MPGAQEPASRDADLVHAADRHAILTATPDLLAQELTGKLLQRLADHGALPVAAVPHVFSAAESFMLYEGRVTHPSGESRLHSSWLGPRMFTGGASLVLILRSARSGPPLQETLRGIKGRGRLGAYGPDDLRGLSRIADRSFSLIHSPDDVAGFFHEAALLIGAPALRASLDAGRAPLAPDLIDTLVPGAPLAAEPHLFDVLPRVVAQAVALLACDPESATDASRARPLLASIAGARRRLNDRPRDASLERHVWNAMQTFVEDLRRLFDAERSAVDWDMPVVGLRRALARARLIRVLVECCSQQRFDPWMSAALAESLRGVDLPLPYWDEHRLHVIAAYHGGAPR